MSFRRVRVLGFVIALISCGSAGSFAQEAEHYGNVGDPYADEGGNPSCHKHLTACGARLSGKDYCVDKDLIAKPDAGGKCFEVSAGTKLDLNGHTIKGRLIARGNAQGAHVFNGAIECDWPDHGSDAGCIMITDSGGPLDKPAELHHLTVHNVAANSVTRGIFVDWSPSSEKPRFGLRIYNTTIATPPCTKAPLTVCVRVNNVRVQSQTELTIEAFQNDWTCSRETNACQGIELFDVINSRIHHNRIDMESDMPETGRAIDCDGNRVPGSDHCEVDFNIIIARRNRAFRVRSSANAYFHDNQVGDCTNTASGCIYLYDQRSTPEDYGNMVIERNTFEMNGGTAIFMRCGRGAIIRDNHIVSTGDEPPHGLFALVTSWGEGCTTDAHFLKNDIAGNPNIKVVSNPPASASATVCWSGMVEGTGNITILKDCPPGSGR